MFGNPDALIQVDMSEYMEKFNVSRIIGSPPGYIGHGEGGELTEKVRRRPYSVVLFDEVEKAHPDVMHILLQILEEGKITDSLGRKIDFRNAIIIMTSNLGADQIQKGGGMGFLSGDQDVSAEKIRDKLLDLAKKMFKPEFINRVDEVIVFRKLNNDDLKTIVNIELDKVRERLRDQHLDLEIDDKVLEFLIERGYQPEYGARPLRRAIERHLEDPIAEEILKGFAKGAKRLKVEVDNQKLLFFPIKEVEEEAEKEKVAKPRSAAKSKAR